MDFTLGSLVSSGNGVSASERSLASMSSETDDSSQQHQRMLSNSAMSQGSAEELFIPSSPFKQRRSASELDSYDPRDDLVAPLKLARNDCFFSGSQQVLKMMQPGSAGTFHALRNSSTLPETRMVCSPGAYRGISADMLLNNESCYNLGTESRLLKGDPQLASRDVSFLAGQFTPPIRSVPYFEHDPYPQQLRLSSPSFPLVMRREDPVHITGVHEGAIGGRQVFTAAQWAELEHQALIYKYLMHGVPVPAELLHPIRRSLANSSGLFSPCQNLTNNLRPAGWPFQLAASGNVDPEPGRCRRTDGKKWRCARPVVPEHKYCERHLHRGRHRKKAAEAQNSTAAAPLPYPKLASSISTVRDNSKSSPFAPEISHSFKPLPTTPISIHSSHNSNRTFSVQNLSTSYGIAIGTTSAGSMTCNQFPLPLHSASGVSSGKDNRSIRGLSKANVDLRPEQLHSDFSGNTRGLSDHIHLTPALPCGIQLYCHVQPQKEQGELAYMADITRRNLLLGHHGQQQHNGPSFFLGEAASGEISKPSESQALRHFFDDWPRTRGASTLPWSDADEEKQKMNMSCTQLSISIPNNSSDISASDSPTRGKTMFSPLRLSMLSNAEDVADPTHMGLGVGTGLGNNSSHRHACWFPRSVEQNVGGPLAEVLQSGTPHPGKKSSLNFLRDEKDINQHHAPCIASPTGVLQKVTLGCCFSDSSSNSSSPGSVRNEHIVSDNQGLNPVLTNSSSRLSN